MRTKKKKKKQFNDSNKKVKPKENSGPWFSLSIIIGCTLRNSFHK